MAFNAAMVWEIRATGNNNNGGGWYDAGGASVDYSQQNAAELSLGDVVTDGSTTVTSTTGGLTDAMVGSIINILTKGRRQITGRTDTNTITVDATVTGGSGLTGNIGGAVADLEEIDSILVDGNVVHVKAGTYNAGGAIAITTSASTAMKSIIGYSAARGDEPAGDDRPLFAMGANGFTRNAYNRVLNIRMTTAHTDGMDGTNGSYTRNCKVENTAAGTVYGFKGSIGSTFVDCEGILTNANDGAAFYVGGDCCVMTNCWAHGGAGGTAEGFDLAGSFCSLIKCTMNDMAIGASVHNYGTVYQCTIDGNGLGINVGGAPFIRVMNCQITNNTTGLSANDGNYDLLNTYDVNNWHGNGTRIVNHTVGDHATFDAPGYNDQPNENFSDVDDTNARTMRLGVG